MQTVDEKEDAGKYLRFHLPDKNRKQIKRIERICTDLINNIRVNPSDQ